MYTRQILTIALMCILTGCFGDDSETVTLVEAQQAMEEITFSEQASALTASSVEIATDFTIGDAVENAAEEIRSFVESQLPCAEITLQQATLTIKYGAKPGNCTYKGQTYAGTHTITVKSNTADAVVVEHTWDNLQNQTVKVSGSATVTWTKTQLSRKVMHTLNWTRLSDGKSAQGSGERLQTPLAGGVIEGINVDGFRTWNGDRGEWNLEIQDVQMRWVDPVPQSGAYVLDTPNEKSLSLSFARLDEDTITVTLQSGSRSFSFNVSKLGTVSGGSESEDI